jgi:hypothetical protein
MLECKSNLLKIIDKIPEDLLYLTLQDLSLIDWDNLLIFDSRAKYKEFSSCRSLHLRMHKHTEGQIKEREVLSKVVACQNTIAVYKYLEINKLVDWVYSNVEGTELGRVMVVNMSPNSSVGEHKDIGPYFTKYRRFHVPLLTNEDVVFTGGLNVSREHAPYGTLCELNNKGIHGVLNNSNLYRIHLIIDVQTNYKW